MTKFLIIRFSSIGDIVLTTPVIRCLKNQAEDAEVHYLTKKAFAPILAGNPYIDKIHLLNNSINTTIEELKAEEFDYIIDLHHNLRTLFVKNKLRILSFSYNKLNFEKWLITTFKINRLPKEHIVERYLSTVKLFDITNDGKGLDYYISPEDKLDVKHLPEKFQNGYIAFVIGAKHGTKKMPVEKTISIINRTQLPVILLGGKEDASDGEKITEATGTLSYNGAGKYTLGQSASLVEQAKLVVTHDTGLMHIAAAYKKKIISVWGNTIPEFGMYPYLPNPESQIIEVTELKCRPCSKIGYDKCPKGHFNCMNKIDEQTIITAIHTMWGA